MPKPKTPLIETRRSPIHGNGVFALRDIAKGTRITEYSGELISHKKADRLYEGGSETGHTFLFTLNDTYIIDANVRGNDAMWINHSCDPNCEAVVEEDEDEDPAKDRVFIEAIRDIRAGEELAYNYGITLEEKHTRRLKKVWECRCGAANCSGTMLQPKKKK